MFDREPPEEQRVSRSDFLICRGNGKLGLVGTAVVPGHDHPDLVFPDTVISASLDLNVIDPGFAEVAWRQPWVRSQIESSARTTSGIHKVSQGTLAEVLLPVPAMGAQSAFRHATDAVTVVQARCNKGLRKSDDLFASLQARAFAGRL